MRLVSSSDHRALEIRDHIVPLVRECGAIECQRGPVRLIVLDVGPWTFNHWTPFNEISPVEASSRSYRKAIVRQHTQPDLAYGLDIWRGLKVLSILWGDDGAIELISFVRGAWEHEALTLTREQLPESSAE